jgi:hypothetical protein
LGVPDALRRRLDEDALVSEQGSTLVDFHYFHFVRCPCC